MSVETGPQNDQPRRGEMRGNARAAAWQTEHFAPLGLGSLLMVALQTLRPAGTDACGAIRSRRDYAACQATHDSSNTR